MALPLVAFLELTLAQCCIAVGIVLAKHLTESIPVMLLLSLRFFICGIIALSVTKLAGLDITRNRDGEKISARDWRIIFFQACCGGMFFNLLMIGGLKYTTATMAGVITSTIPAAITVLSVILLRESVSKSQVLAVLLAVVGLVVLCLGKEDQILSGPWYQQFLGDILVFLSIIPESMFTIIAKWFGSHVKPSVMSAIVLIINALLFLPFLVITLSLYSLKHLSLATWLMLFVYALMSNLFYQFWYQGLRNTTANTAALFTSVMPVATTVLSVSFLHESINLTQFAGMLLIVISIICGANLTNRRHASP